MPIATRPPPPPKRDKPEAVEVSRDDTRREVNASADALDEDLKAVRRAMAGSRNESSVLFSLGLQKAYAARGGGNTDVSIFGKLSDVLGESQLSDVHPVSAHALQEYRKVAREVLTHDLKLWRERRARAYRAWYIPHVIEPVALGVLVSLYFLLPSLPFPGDVRTLFERVLSVLVALLGAITVGHRLSLDPTGKARGYIGRLDRAINMVEGYRAQLDLQDTVSAETIEFITKSCKVVHSVLRPDEADL